MYMYMYMYICMYIYILNIADHGYPVRANPRQHTSAYVSPSSAYVSVRLSHTKYCRSRVPGAGNHSGLDRWKDGQVADQNHYYRQRVRQLLPFFRQQNPPTTGGQRHY
jgi:hypothetical protein